MVTETACSGLLRYHGRLKAIKWLHGRQHDPFQSHAGFEAAIRPWRWSRPESPPGTAATTQTADGHRMRPVSPCGPPRLAMWRFGCPMIRIDAGGTAGAQSAVARAHAECCPRKSPRSRFFLNSTVGRSYNRGPGFESPKSIRNQQWGLPRGQSLPLRAFRPCYGPRCLRRRDTPACT